MEPGKLTRRLRVSGLIALLIIALVTIAEAGLLTWRIATGPARTQALANSAVRRSDVMEVLYRAQRPAGQLGWAVALTRSIDELQQIQRSLNDLTSAQTVSYDAFVAAVRRLAIQPGDRRLRDDVDRLGDTFAAVAQARTQEYVANIAALRARVRNEELSTVAITLSILLVLYFLILRPAESFVARSVEKLEERRQRFAAMFDNSLEMMAIYDAQGRVERANSTALAALGYGQEVVGEHFSVHVAAGEQRAATRAFAFCLAGHASEFETVFLDSSGQEILVRANLAPIIVDGKVVGVAGAARDIRGERRNELELVRSRERFRSIFEHSPSAAMGISTDGVITEVNTELERLTGYNAHDLVGKHVSILTPAARRATVMERIGPALGGTARAFESVLLRRDGSERIIMVDTSPIRVDGRNEGVFAIMKDVTQERILERKFGEQQDRLRALYLTATSAAEDTGAQIEAALSLGARACDVPYGFVFELVEGHLVVRYRVGPGELFPTGYEKRLTQAIGGRLLSAQRVLAVDDLTVEPWASELAERKLPWKSYIGAPLFVHGALYGVLALMDTEPQKRSFEQADFEFVEVLGSMVGTALSRARRETDLQVKAFRDPLTGAANRALLEEHLDNAIARAHRTGERLALYYLDLDGFKPINDVYGHAAGDVVLCEITRRLSLAIREYDLVARIGGDEFVVLQSAISEIGSIKGMTQRL